MDIAIQAPVALIPVTLSYDAPHAFDGMHTHYKTYGLTELQMKKYGGALTLDNLDIAGDMAKSFDKIGIPLVGKNASVCVYTANGAVKGADDYDQNGLQLSRSVFTYGAMHPTMHILYNSKEQPYIVHETIDNGMYGLQVGIELNKVEDEDIAALNIENFAFMRDESHNIILKKVWPSHKAKITVEQFNQSIQDLFKNPDNPELVSVRKIIEPVFKTYELDSSRMNGPMTLKNLGVHFPVPEPR